MLNELTEYTNRNFLQGLLLLYPSIYGSGYCPSGSKNILIIGYLSGAQIFPKLSLR